VQAQTLSSRGRGRPGVPGHSGSPGGPGAAGSLHDPEWTINLISSTQHLEAGGASLGVVVVEESCSAALGSELIGPAGAASRSILAARTARGERAVACT
jgi:hypothetical protein